MIADSEAWKAGCWAEADLEGRLEEGTLWLEEGSGTGWTYGMGVDVYSRDEGDVGGGRGKRGEGGRDEARAKDGGLNIRKMRRVVELLEEGSDTPRHVHLYFIKSRSLAEPISAVASIAGPSAKL